MSAKIDETRPFVPVRIAVLTVSDTRTLEDDKSGNVLVERLQAAGHRLADRDIVKDDFDVIVARLRAWIADTDVDVVIATGGTGVTGRDVSPEAFQSVYEKEIAGFGDKIACVLAPNMSVGVNVSFRLIEEAARLLGDAYDIEVIETHHNQKIDAPSGTAVRMGEILARVMGKKYPEDAVFHREGQTGVRPEGVIGMQTLRGGDVPGEHTVYFFGMGERVEITHRAGSRDNFAAGAVRAVRWVADKSPGIYGMADVLGL